METIMRGELAGSATILNADALQNLEVAAGSIELDQPYIVDGFDELRRAAIHDRDFLTVDLDQGVVDAKAAQCGKQVLDGRHGGSVAIAKHGTQPSASHVPLIGSDLGALCVAVGEKEA